MEVPVSDIRVGDTVWFDEFERGHKACPVSGFGSVVVNGRDMKGVLYVERYDHGGDYTWSSNNYVHGETARIKPRG